MEKVALISGGSSGIGRETALCLLGEGYVVYEISRSGQSVHGIRHIDGDVTCLESMKSAVTTVENECGCIDLLICNAGMGISGAVEFTTQEDARRIIDVNFFGVFNLIQASLPLLRKAKNPKIINVSSIAADIAIPFQAFYSASKAAVSSLTLSLANELRPFGVCVSAVLPGDTSTGFTQARSKNESGDDIYGKAISRAVSGMEKDEKNGMSPKKIAYLITKIAKKRRAKCFYTAGISYKAILLLRKLLPITLVNRIVGKIYG